MLHKHIHHNLLPWADSRYADDIGRPEFGSAELNAPKQCSSDSLAFATPISLRQQHVYINLLQVAQNISLAFDFSFSSKLHNMTPESMQAVKIVSLGKAEIQTAQLPKLRDHYVLVKVRAVAINPTDWCDL